LTANFASPTHGFTYEDEYNTRRPGDRPTDGGASKFKDKFFPSDRIFFLEQGLERQNRKNRLMADSFALAKLQQAEIGSSRRSMLFFPFKRHSFVTELFTFKGLGQQLWGFLFALCVPQNNRYGIIW